VTSIAHLCKNCSLFSPIEYESILDDDQGWVPAILVKSFEMLCLFHHTVLRGNLLGGLCKGSFIFGGAML